ncbi:MAG: gluconokinase [Pseudomonadota bacterium]|nr:gluconokinase [Pseudomonadota bacterium]
MPPAAPDPKPRLAVVVMGVAGCGKSTVGSALAAELALPFVDGDSLHSAANVAKMRAGTPLDDADRAPWLERIGDCLGDSRSAPAGIVVACSALKRAYRDRLRAAAPTLRFVFLDVALPLLEARLATRHGHYMPATMLRGQLATLEPPTDAEADVLRYAVDAPADVIARAAATALRGPATTRG